MEIRRSEVYFGMRGEEFYNVNKAMNAGLKYYCFLDSPLSNVYHTNLNRKKVCRVSDLIDDRPNPFPPLEAESSSDTQTDRARDASLRDCKK